MELSEKEVGAFKQNSVSVDYLHANERPNRKQPKSNFNQKFEKSSTNTNTSKPQSKRKVTCYRCGDNHTIPHCQVSPRITCNFCGRQGHMERICLKKREETHYVDEENSEEEYIDIVEICPVDEPKLRDKIYTVLNIQGKPIKMEVDTGAAVTLMWHHQATKLFPEIQIKKTTLRLVTFCKNTVNVNGYLTVKVTYENKDYQAKLYLTEVERAPLLGREWIRCLITGGSASGLFSEILQVNFNVQDVNKEVFIKKLFNKYTNVTD
ncbi:hypothetical protein TSAR_009614 [Trichomalopsis sarcophagae]|uniref:Retropepsins domain-containing protein n=1 Tax=Trichomalopsis sarcophagae TaxID=543379 RepID=A0A232EE80_9HYME|nr:hypothetical protein TSAR_009614 [Trichomalopsis sarcophagae]